MSYSGLALNLRALPQPNTHEHRLGSLLEKNAPNPCQRTKLCLQIVRLAH